MGMKKTDSIHKKITVKRTHTLSNVFICGSLTEEHVDPSSLSMTVMSISPQISSEVTKET